MQINNSQPSFGMAYKKPNLKGFIATSIDAITQAYPESVKRASDVDIKIAKGTSEVRTGKVRYGGRMHDDISAEPVIDYEPCFNISFSRPAKTVFAKIAKALGLSEKYSPVYHKSLPLTGEAAQQKKTLIKALDAGKIKYRKEKGIEIEEATAKFKQAMKPEKLENGLPKSKKMSSSPRFSPGGFGPL